MWLCGYACGLDGQRVYLWLDLHEGGRRDHGSEHHGQSSAVAEEFPADPAIAGFPLLKDPAVAIRAGGRAVVGAGNAELDARISVAGLSDGPIPWFSGAAGRTDF
jgi:hypothetical protein